MELDGLSATVVLEVGSPDPSSTVVMRVSSVVSGSAGRYCDIDRTQYLYRRILY